jgi:hypothetical protein
MDNLLVSSSEDAWNGDPWQIEVKCCVHVYTDKEITQKLGELDTSAVADLKRLPCILAYEAANKIDPHFGILRNIIKRQGEVKVQYELQPLTPFLTAEELSAIAFDLDISK